MGDNSDYAKLNLGKGLRVDLRSEFERSSAFKARVAALLKRLETDGTDFCGEECDLCGVVDSEPCCPICLEHNGGKLGGPYRHAPDCELAALLKESGS